MEISPNANLWLFHICLYNQGSKGVNWGTVIDVFTHSVYTIMVLNWSSSKPIVWLGLIEVYICVGSEDEVVKSTDVNIQQPGVSGESQNTKGLSPVLRLLLVDDIRSGMRSNYADADSKDHVVQCTRLRYKSFQNLMSHLITMRLSPGLIVSSHW